MTKNLLLVLISLFTIPTFSQSDKTITLKGRIVADSIEVQDVVVINKRTKKGTVSLPDGSFFIDVKVKDTLEFKSLQFQNKEIIINDSHIETVSIVITLTTKVTVLDELELTPLTLSGDLKKDTGKIPVYTPSLKNIAGSVSPSYSDDKYYQGPKNIALPNNFAPTGVNILGVFSLLFKKRKPDPSIKQQKFDIIREREKLKDYKLRPFSELMLERFPKSFFTTTLNIEESQLTSFFAYAQLFDKDLIFYLNETNKLQLIEYLTKKSELFIANSESENVNLRNED